MLSRRDALLALGCGCALAASQWLRPRRPVRLLPPGQPLDRIIPREMPGWASSEGGDIIVPRTPGSLASRLYSATVARLYTHAGSGIQVMLLVAYGEQQSDLLQLHRPESCYPAVGFQIRQRRMMDLPLPSRASLPAVALTAVSGDRVEDILYWTRLGEALPRTASEQRRDRLEQAIHGEVADGVLVRASIVRTAGAQEFAALESFMLALIAAVRPGARSALIGTALAHSFT